MARRRLIYEGKTKILFEGAETGTFVQYFKDDAIADNGKRKGVITGKGVLNNRISEFLMTHLKTINIPTHFVKRLNMREQLIHSLEMFPLQIVVHNRVSKTLSQKFSLKEGDILPRTLVEYYYKNHELKDPLVTEEHIITFNWATPHELDEISTLSLRINDFLSGVFAAVGLALIDIKLEFGRFWENDEMRIFLGDEISPDHCRLCDIKSGEIMDKDRFRYEMGNVEEAYQEVARRLGLLSENIFSGSHQEKHTSLFTE